MHGGCVVMMAAMYLFRALQDSTPRRRVRLFEGFVSFKPRGSRGSHCEDVQALRAMVHSRSRPPGAVLAAAELVSDASETITSAFSVRSNELWGASGDPNATVGSWEVTA